MQLSLQVLVSKNPQQPTLEVGRNYDPILSVLHCQHIRNKTI